MSKAPSLRIPCRLLARSENLRILRGPSLALLVLIEHGLNLSFNGTVGFESLDPAVELSVFLFGVHERIVT